MRKTAKKTSGFRQGMGAVSCRDRVSKGMEAALCACGGWAFCFAGGIKGLRIAP
jgi:hypothetical protein